MKNQTSDKKAKYSIDYVPNKNIPAGTFAYIVMVIKRNPFMWAFMLFVDVIHGLRYPVAFVFIGKIIDILLSLEAGGTIPPVVWQYVAGIFGVLLIGELAHLGPHYVIFNWIGRARAQFRSDLLAYTLDHSFTYFQNRFAGAVARKVNEAFEKTKDLQAHIRWEIFLPLISMVTAAIVLFNISGLYGSFVLAFVAMIVVPVLFKLKKIGAKSQIFADERSRVSGQIVDTLTNMAAVKSYAREDLELAEHTKIAEDEMKAWHKMLRVFLLLDNYRRLTLVAYGGGMMAACVLGWQHGLVSAGEITTIMGVSYGFTANAWSISFGIIRVSESLGYLNDSLKTLINPKDVEDVPDAGALNVEHAEIRFENINFQYQKQPVFKDLNLNISSGQRLGLVGLSGAGKSTLVNLLQRFFDVQSGEILIDGQDIKMVTQKSLRENIAIIPQDTSLFHRTLMENIRYGHLDASDEDVIEAAKKAHAHAFITELPDGYETLVGERGVKLSGGQRQRIAIARAILKNAPILILDEATSALDSDSEKLIQDSLQELMRGKTVIAIAHRLSTISALDRLIVMDQGAIAEDGNHEGLLKNDGLYAKLWGMQSGGFIGE